MLLLDLALLLALLPVCSFAPGFNFVRKFPWSPMEKLCSSVGLSLIFIYLASWAVFWLGPGASGDSLTRGISAGISLACCVLAFVARKDIVTLFHSVRVKRTVIGYAFLFGWTLTLLAIIRHYSGFGWIGDWLEHFQRTLFFLHRFPTTTPIIGDYLLPARPPMMNVLASFFLAQTEDRFELFQVIFTFLNLLLFLPCCLFMPALGVSRRPRILPLVALFAFSPVVMEEATYSWTKAFASFFVLISLWLYLAALRKKDRLRMIAAFLAAATGLLVHYMAGPYIVFLVLHYMLRAFWKRPGKWVELAAIAGLSGLLLLTWFGWSLNAYGPNGTFKSNTSVTSSQQYAGSNLVKIGANLLDTLIPIQMLTHGLAFTSAVEPNRAGLVRDNAFVLYQQNIIFGMGLVGGPFVLWLLYGSYRGANGKPRPEWRFWRVMIPFCIVAGIAVVGERDIFGSAHLTMLPLEALGLSLIAASFPWRRNVAVLLLAGCTIDFGLGVFLQAHTEALSNTPGRTVFTSAVQPWDGHWRPGPSGPESLSVSAWINWFAKHRFALTRQMLEKLASFNPGAGQSQQDAIRVTSKLQKDMAEDGTLWHGWWARHDYELGFLGDDVARILGDDGKPLEFVELAAFAGLMAAMVRRMTAKPRQAAPVPVATVRVAQVRVTPKAAKARRSR